MFGSQVQVDFGLAPLLKGLRVGKIHSTLMETTHVLVELKGESNRTREYKREVASDDYELPEGMEMDVVDGAEGYVFSRHLQLPRSLSGCLQTVREKNVEVKHQLKFIIALHNPDGHLSEVRTQRIKRNLRLTRT